LKDVKVVIKIMDGIQDGRGNLSSLIKMAKIGPGEIPTGITAAIFV